MKTSARGLAALAGVAIAAASPATAQEAEKPKAPVEVEGVTVSGQSAQVRTSIDRKSYAVGNDIAAATGSATDVLRNVPAVEVDGQGAISLRGDPNVVIMIDGVRVGGGQGGGGGGTDAVSQIPGDQIDRVEVITNPSAALGPEGSGGVINIITKKGRGAGASGSVRAQVGTGERVILGTSANYNSAKLGLTSDLGYRAGPQTYRAGSRRAFTDPLTGVTTEDASVVDGRSNISNTTARVSVDYDLTTADHLTAQLRGNLFRNSPYGNAGTIIGAGAKTWMQRGDYPVDIGAASAEWRRRFGADDHTLVLRGSFESHNEDDAYRRFETPTAVGIFNSHRDMRVGEGKLEYKRPYAGGAKLVAGLEFNNREVFFRADNRRAPTEAAAEVLPPLYSAFFVTQLAKSAYVTYERPGDWTVLAGLRIEDVQLVAEDKLGVGGRNPQDYLQAYPSLHLSHELSESDKVILSYSRRVVRPLPFQLNPIRYPADPTIAFEGNPDLEPEFINSLEAGFERRKGRNTYLATLFFRQGKGGATTTFFTDGEAIVYRWANIGKRTSTGLELVVNRPITPKLSMNVSANAAYVEIESEILGLAYAREDFVVGGRGSLDWQPTAKDALQLNLVLNARRPNPQGYTASMQQVNLGYRRKVNDRLNLTLTVQDAFKGAVYKDVAEGPILNYTLQREIGIRAAFVGFSYALGGKPGAKKEEFDFGG